MQDCVIHYFRCMLKVDSLVYLYINIYCNIWHNTFKHTLCTISCLWTTFSCKKLYNRVLIDVIFLHVIFSFCGTCTFKFYFVSILKTTGWLKKKDCWRLWTTGRKVLGPILASYTKGAQFAWQRFSPCERIQIPVDRWTEEVFVQPQYLRFKCLCLKQCWVGFSCVRMLSFMKAFYISWTQGFRVHVVLGTWPR
jgi:hypothetical protein